LYINRPKHIRVYHGIQFLDKTVAVFGRTVTLCYGAVALSILYVCNFGVLRPNGWMDQDATRYELDLSSGDIVLGGDPAPLTERGTAAPYFLVDV